MTASGDERTFPTTITNGRNAAHNGRSAGRGGEAPHAVTAGHLVHDRGPTGRATSAGDLARVGARRWNARIMITWGAVSAATMLATSAGIFYALRFLPGLAEAGFFPGIF